MGSGLAAVGAIRALVANGQHPLVLDIGRTLPSHLEQLRQKLATSNPSEWSFAQREELGRNDGVVGRVVPRKLVMGSDYFYSTEQAEITSFGDFQSGTPPWSPARGGFSVGWGAAVLPPAKTDLGTWPITHDEILSNARLALEGIPLSEPIDELTPVFGSLGSGESGVLPLSAGQLQLLRLLQKQASGKSTSQVLVGQSRLLTESGVGLPRSCRQCGLCSAGCVYGSIYSAEQDIARWIAEDRITYKSDVQVFYITERDNVVRIDLVERGEARSIETDRLFLAAGAVNSSRILLNSSFLPSDTVTLHRTGGVLQVFANLQGFPIAWPSVNTQTSHVIELRSERASPYWAHVQLGQPNELVLRKLGVSAVASPGFRQRAMKRAAGHLVTTMLNINSAHGPQYEMQVTRRRDGIPNVETRQAWSAEGKRVVNALSHDLGRFMRRARFWRVPFASQDSVAAQGYHFGASFPMVTTPREEHDTDTLGRPFGWSRVHVVDTSVLPEIPATGVGLITMANSYRIANQSVLGSQ